MLKKIRGVNYKTKEVVELEVSVLTTCAWEGCKNAAITAIVFDDPYPLGDQTLQGSSIYAANTLIICLITISPISRAVDNLMLRDSVGLLCFLCVLART
jgi:hypothetical protein